jgi:hypothetical protein
MLAYRVHDLAQQILFADVISSTSVPGAFDNVALERSISSAAIARKFSSSASPASSCSLSIRSVFGRGKGLPVTSSKLRKSAKRLFWSVVDPSGFFR